MGSSAKIHDVAAEMATIDAVLRSGAVTRRTDAFVLAWVKMEKQLRRLFSYLVFQHPKFTKADEKALVEVLVDRGDLYSYTFARCIDALGSRTVKELVGPRYDHFQSELARIKKYRNKIMHGQITGQNLQSAQIEKDVKLLREWIEALAVGAQQNFGYDGIARNTFRKAKSVTALAQIEHPFSTVAEFKSWLEEIVAERK